MCSLICTFQDSALVSHIGYFNHRQVLKVMTLLPSVLDFVKYITMFMFVFRSRNSNIMSKHVYAATVSDSHSFYVILLQILNFFPTYFLVVSASFIQYFFSIFILSIRVHSFDVCFEFVLKMSWCVFTLLFTR